MRYLKKGGFCHAKDEVHGGADSLCTEACGDRDIGGRGNPQDGDYGADCYRWKKKYGGLGMGEVRELRQLREENRKLKQMVADLSLDKQMLQEVLSKKL